MPTPQSLWTWMSVLREARFSQAEWAWMYDACPLLQPPIPYFFGKLQHPDLFFSWLLFLPFPFTLGVGCCSDLCIVRIYRKSCGKFFPVLFLPLLLYFVFFITAPGNLRTGIPVLCISTYSRITA